MAEYPKSGGKNRTLSPAGGDFSNNSSQHMFGWRGTGEQSPGQSSQAGTGGRRDQKASGGGTGIASSDESKSGQKSGMAAAANRYGAGPQTPGQSAASGARADGFAHGGKTNMFPNRGSKRAEGGMSSPS